MKKLGLFISISLGFQSVFQTSFGVGQVSFETGLVLLSLHLVGVEIVNLLTQFSHIFVMLHSEGSQSSLLGDVEFIKFTLDACQLGFSLLVQFDLSSSVGSSFIQAGCNIFNV